MKSENIKIIVDFLCIILLFLGFFKVHFYIKPHERGFFCDDQTLMYPYISHTVFSSLKIMILALVFLFMIIIGEIFCGIKSNRQPLKLFNCKIPNWINFSYQKVGSFSIGALTTFLITDIIKYSLGRLRPNFIDLCKPSINCSSPINHKKYIAPDEFYCTNNYVYNAEKEARLSFPSNHASCVTYFGVFLICYLQLRMTCSYLKLFKYLLQVSLVLMISFISMTRISDYMHHWSDVAAGILIGFVNALITVFIVADLFKECEPENISCELEQENENELQIVDD